tara:strand:- start:945 stop:1391 length:447 start_codon:yes stop_codon:yes gene_type:complete
MKIENSFLETRRAITHLNNVTHISWVHIQDGDYDVKLHFDNEQIIQKMSRSDLESLKEEFKTSKAGIVNSERQEANFTVGGLKVINGFIYISNKWCIDLMNVDFISFKQDEDTYNYFVKLHIGSKHVRMWLSELKDVNELIEIWKMYR